MRRLLLVAASLGLAMLIAALEQGGPGGPFVRAVLANLAVVTWSSFVLPLRGLPRFDEYYALRRWERSGRLYRRLGVPLFRALVRRGPLAMFNPALPAAWQRGEPERIERETRAAEAGHAIAFGVVLVLAAVAWTRGDPARAAWLAALDVPMNLYPVLLQRDHRLRLAEHVRRGDLSRSGATTPDEARPGAPLGSAR
jgi:hypothetical protein